MRETVAAGLLGQRDVTAEKCDAVARSSILSSWQHHNDTRTMTSLDLVFSPIVHEMMRGVIMTAASRTMLLVSSLLESPKSLGPSDDVGASSRLVLTTAFPETSARPQTRLPLQCEGTFLIPEKKRPVLPSNLMSGSFRPAPMATTQSKTCWEAKRLKFTSLETIRIERGIELLCRFQGGFDSNPLLQFKMQRPAQAIECAVGQVEDNKNEKQGTIEGNLNEVQELLVGENKDEIQELRIKEEMNEVEERWVEANMIEVQEVRVEKNIHEVQESLGSMSAADSLIKSSAEYVSMEIMAAPSLDPIESYSDSDSADEDTDYDASIERADAGVISSGACSDEKAGYGNLHIGILAAVGIGASFLIGINRR